MGTVKYTGPVASFHCPTEATIRSLKVHFSPKQLGDGTPSPENVREIVGWDGVEVNKAGKNLFNPATVTMNKEIGSDGNPLATGSSNNWCITDFIPVKPNTTYIAKALLTKGSGRSAVYDINKEKISTKMEVLGADAETVISIGSTGRYVRLTVRIGDGLNTVFKEASSDISYEPYRGETVNYEFGVLGKNKLNVNAEQQAPDNTNMMPTNKRIFTPNTYCVGMSWSNYYMPNNVTSYSVNNGTITVTNGNVYGLGYPVRVTPGQAYFLSATTTNGRAHIAYFSADGTYVSGVSANVLNSSFTVPNDVKTAVIIFYSNSGEATFSNIQLELGSTATTYEPYDPNKTVYGGWVDLITGEVCEEYSLFAPNENSYITIIKNDMFSQFRFQDAEAIKTRLSGYCSHFKLYANPNVYGVTALDYLGTACQLILQQDSSVYVETVADLKAWLQAQREAGTPFHIVFERAEPNYYNLSPHSTELKTFLSINNVWSNADYVEVEYDLYETQSTLARKQFIIANQPHVVKPAAAPLQNFVTDMAAPLKECKVYFSPVQEGTGDPSPENVRVISRWTGLEVYRTGKNLCDTPTSADITANWPIDGSSFSKTIYGLPTDRTFTLQANITKDLDKNISNTRFYLNGKLISGRFFSTGTPTGIKSISNQPTDDGALKLSHNRLGLTSYGAEFNNIQLELGSIATKYEPYTGTTIPITFPSEVGTIYGGYVDLVKGEVWAEYYKVTLDGENVKANRAYEQNGNYGCGYVYTSPSGLSAKYKNGVPTNIWCENAPLYIGFTTIPEPPYVYAPLAGALYLVMYFAKAADHPELADNTARINYGNEWLKSNPITVVYQLATPTLVTTLTPTQLKTLRGTNNIWSNANGNIELSYWKH